MSDFADDMEAMREYQQKKKAANLKTNSELVKFLSGFLDFKIKEYGAFHMRLFHETKGPLDYWPSTRKGMWLSNKKSFVISDIEQYILKHFS